MGVGYTVSALHRLLTPVRPYSPTVASIVAWRQRVASKYRDQLAEELTWDESSTYEASANVATGDDVMLHFAAAALDQHGLTGLAGMISRRQPTSQEMAAAFAAADRRGFGGRFPQLLLGARIWLPFSNNLMIEEPDWDGKVARYGSVPRLADELTDLRSAITEADPSVERSAGPEATAHSLAGAWEASATVLRLATIAWERHLPLWTTGS